MARPFPVEERRRHADRRPRPRRRLRAGCRCHARGRAAADRLRLSLCLCDADRCCGTRHLVHVRGAALMPICIIASWRVTARVREYMIAFLLLETLMVGVFCSLDLVLFYLFFEGGLIPMFLIIGVWGGPRRVYASFKFFLYTLLGSVLMLLAIMALYWNAGTTDIPTLMHTAVPRSLQTWAWLAFFASFDVQLRMCQ